MAKTGDDKIDIKKFDPNMRIQQPSAAAIRWFSPAEVPFRLTGFAWFGKDRIYRRLPLKNAGKLPQAVNSLADCTAGGQIGFRSDSRKISIKVMLAGPANMCHMPSTGQCGFDLYMAKGKSLRFYISSKYNHNQTSYELTLFEHVKAELRTFRLFFPLYQGVKKILIGLDEDASIKPPPPFASNGRIIFYGTSITQGGCASRPGMAYTNILGRRLNMEIVNLGFSGSGKGEPEVAEAVAKVPRPALFVLDYDGNCPSADRLAETLGDFIRILRRRHRYVPILVVSRIAFARDLVQESSHRERLARRCVQMQVVRAHRDNGDRRVFFLDGAGLLGHNFDECTVDGVHPTDLGFMQIAKRMETAIRRILADKKQKLYVF